MFFAASRAFHAEFTLFFRGKSATDQPSLVLSVDQLEINSWRRFISFRDPDWLAIVHFGFVFLQYKNQEIECGDNHAHAEGCD